MTSAPFTGKTALVTGASRGIGRATALRLARFGADVFVHYNRSAAEAEEVADAIRSLGHEATPLQADLGTQDGADLAAKLSGTLDLLVLNAGIHWAEMALFMDLEDWDQVMATNVRGSLAVCQAVVPAMAKRGSGSVVFVSSEAGTVGVPGAAAYSASKAALVGLAKSLAREVASKGVRINVVSPGPVETDMLKDMPFFDEAQATALIPLGRLAKPEEIAAAITFLLSEDASFITGTVLPVHGGLSL